MSLKDDPTPLKNLVHPIHFFVTSTPDKVFEGFLNLLTLSGFYKGNLSAPD